MKTDHVLIILIIILVIISSCDKSPTKEDADIILIGELTDDNTVNLHWGVRRHPMMGAWSCFLNRKTPADTCWIRIEEFFPDSDEFVYSERLNPRTRYEYQVIARSLFEAYYSNIIIINTH